MSQCIERILKKIDIAFEWGSALILSGMTLLIFVQVIFRYVIIQPLAWSEELAKFLFIWLTFVAGYVAARRGNHIGVELIQNLVPKAKAFMQFVSYLISSAFFGMVLYYCLSLWSKLMAQISPATKIPMAFVYLGMMIGSFFMCLSYLIDAFGSFKKQSGGIGK